MNFYFTSLFRKNIRYFYIHKDCGTKMYPQAFVFYTIV